MTEALHRTALSIGGRQGGQELEATQTEQPLSDLDFLILNGMDTAQIQKHLNDGISLEELANAARSIVSRGESLADEPEAEDACVHTLSSRSERHLTASVSPQKEG